MTRRLAAVFSLVIAVWAGRISMTAQSWQPPSEAQRCPSKWGAADQLGASNYMNPQNVLRAVRLIRTGEIVDLAHTLKSDMPYTNGRRFDLYTKRTMPNPGSNRRSSNEELVLTELGHVGTHIDALSHQQIDNDLYNCVKADDVATRSGFAKLGAEHIGSLVTRGVLLDVAASKHVDVLPPTYEITIQDLEQTLRDEKIALQPGDAIAINTGWGRWWGADNTRYVKTSPGLGASAAEWLSRQNPMLVGLDNISLNVTPNPDPAVSNPVHQIFLVVNGIYIVENMKLDEVAAKRLYEFAFILEPLKIEGGTGSAATPIAIR